MFLHSSWRCGSTYVWAKFRNNPDYYCYFEPLNEHLADATPDFIDRFAPWSYANHPVLDRPYLDEFRPLLSASGGLGQFPATLPFGQYRAGRGTDLPELARYFGLLEHFARDRGQVPVFGCVRTDLRVAWFRAHLPGVHIALHRSCRQQFLSCLAQAAKGNIYFLERGLTILDNNRDDPGIVALARLIGLREGGQSCFASFFADPDWPNQMSKLYMVAYGLHRFAREQSRFAHLVLDMDRISAEPEAARAAEVQLNDLTGASVSFADCAIETYERELSWSAAFFDEIEAKVDEALHVGDARAA